METWERKKNWQKEEIKKFIEAKNTEIKCDKCSKNSVVGVVTKNNMGELKFEYYCKEHY